MKRVLIKDTFRRIRKTKGRFFAILAIIAIGCGFFAGVKVTSPDMKKTADRYYSDQNLMDIHIVSSLGFDSDEIALISEDDEVKGISGGYSADMLINMDDGTSPVTRVYSINTSCIDNESVNYINRPVIVNGRMPEKSNECLIEKDTPDVYNIGDTITLSSGDDKTDTEDIIKNNTFKIVGEVTWVRYVDFQRGTTTIGNGSIGSFLIIPDSAFAFQYYTDVYLTLKKSDEFSSFDEGYQNYTDKQKERFEQMAQSIHKKRLEEIYSEISDAQTDVDKGQAEYDDGFNELNIEISDAEKKLSQAENDIEKNEEELKISKEKYEDGMKKYNAAIEQLNQSKKSLQEKRDELNKARTEEKTIRQLHSNLKWFIDEYASLYVDEKDPVLLSTIEMFKPLDTPALSVSQMALVYAASPIDSQQKDASYSALIKAADLVCDKIIAADEQISAGQSEINKADAQIRSSENKLDDTREELSDAKAKIDEGEKKIADARDEVTKNRKELLEKKSEGEQKLDKARDELENGKTELQNANDEYNSVADNLKWYVSDRNSNIGYSSFWEDADRVDSIARIFPVFFIIVAALVCLNTMIRMVEEQRTEIGTLKALGYGNIKIMSQYIFYAASASIIGVAVGLAVGFNLFPIVIFNAYKMMYYFPDVKCEFRWDYSAGCLVVSFACTCLSAVAACYKELRVHPAELMRPKPPKNGKRVLLEHVPFIWKKMSFNQKITIRNIFRYKKRVLMAVVGIGGCTALMLTGFGLKNAISVIVDKQFGEIQKFDAMCIFSCDDTDEYQTLYKNINDVDDIDKCLFGMQKSLTVTYKNKTREAYAIVPEAPQDINEYINLRKRIPHNINQSKNVSYQLDDTGVIINEKLAKLMEIKTGDSIGFENTDRTVTVTAITENYSQHYIYFTPSLYREIFGEYKDNIVYVNFKEGYNADNAVSEILSNSQVMSVKLMKFSGDTFRKLIKSLNVIVLVIIGSSGALAFVVLYNLSNINITERMRELATIKVLGFYDSEVSAYIYRENTISAILGMISGLIGGIYLTGFVIQTSEVDVVMFYPDIPAYCYVCAGALTMIFTVAVNVILHFKLKKIDMAGSMKAIE